MASKKLNLTILLFFITVSIVLISIEIATHFNRTNYSTADYNNPQLLEVKSTDSLDYEIDEEEIRLPVDMKE